MSAPRRFLSVAQTAETLGLSEPTVYRAIRQGSFPAVKIRGRYVVPSKALDQMEADAIREGLVDAADYVITRKSADGS